MPCGLNHTAFLYVFSYPELTFIVFLSENEFFKDY